jgi:uncharacterized protein (TIGR03435 family)
MSSRHPFGCISSLAIASLLATALHLAAQQPPQTTAAAARLPVYDVVSIHENKSGAFGTRLDTEDATWSATNITLTNLLTNACNIRRTLISGLPKWADSVRFDVNAKVSDPDIATLRKLSKEQRSAMLLALLSDRFHLSAHIQTRTLPVYELVIAKGGPRLRQDNSDPGQSGDPSSPDFKGTFTLRNSELIATGIPMSVFAYYFASRAGRTIIDKTGLKGKYDLSLKWTPDDQPPADNGSGDRAPDLFTALQEQLGLKLEPSKGPVDTLVIDHVEMPTEN